MATIIVDPFTRIEGHLKVTVFTNTSNMATDAQCSGTLWRGIERILNKRDPRDAPQITGRICGVCPTPHQLASAAAIDVAQGITVDDGISTAGDIDNYSTTIPANGTIIRNLIHGSEYLMSHITHLYALSALDFIDTSTYPGMAPWVPSYTASDMLDGSTGLGGALVAAYVKALDIRRRCASLGAMWGGRKPMQNAIVPGGVTTNLDTTYPRTPVSTDYDKYGPFNLGDTINNFVSQLNIVRDFVNQTYIPNVLLVATSYTKYFYSGTTNAYLLSYGDFEYTGTGTLAIKRGLVSPALGGVSFDQANILEYVDYSHYAYGLNETALHPFAGRTDATVKTSPQISYSWLKAPRYNNAGTPVVCEVGPLARVVNTYARGGGPTVSQTGTLVTAWSAVPANYNVINLVTAALGVINTALGGTTNTARLLSTLGRHAARALEAKYVADAMAAWVTTINTSQSAYTYKKLPKQISAGFGLREAQRGALGHWIKIENKKIAKYQCVVPTTWNASPKDALGNHGPAEEALIGTTLGNTTEEQIVNILRTLHPFDFCIACSVHVVGADGKEMTKFAVDPAGEIRVEK
jgi:hydrogenase large subunit